MTQAELDALRQLADAATPGPWTASPRSTDGRVDGLLGAEINELEQPERGQFTSLADAAFIAASREAVPALLDALAAANARAEAAERRAMVAERRLAAGPAAVALKHIDDYGRAQWVNGREAKFRISYAEWWKLMVELGEVQP